MAEVKSSGKKVIKGESLEDLRKAVSEIKKNAPQETAQEKVQEQFIPKETVKAAQDFQSSTFNTLSSSQLSKKDLELKDKFKKFFKKRVEYADLEVGDYVFSVKTLDAIHVLEGETDNVITQDLPASDKMKMLYRRTFGYFIRSLVSMTDKATGEVIAVEDMVAENFGSYEFYKKLESFVIECVPPRLIVDIIMKYADFFEKTSSNADTSPVEMSEKKS